MTTYHGKSGVAMIGANAIAELTSFSVTETAATVDDTAQGDSSDTHLVGTKAWSGSIEGHNYIGDTNGQAALLAGASLSLDLRPTGNTSGLQKLTGTATITSISFSSEKSSVVSFTAQFQGNGALTHGTVSA